MSSVSLLLLKLLLMHKRTPALIRDIMFLLRVNVALIYPATDGLALAKRRAVPYMRVAGVGYGAPLERLHDGRDVLHVLHQALAAQPHLLPYGVEEFVGVVAERAAVRRVHLDPPQVVAPELPVDDCDYFDRVDDDIAHVEVGVGKDVRRAVGEILLRAIVCKRLVLV
jgi:hypothetical protein